MRKTRLFSILALLLMTATGVWAQDYTITLPSVEHGSVVAKVNNSSVTSAAAGATVSLVATPDAGYQLKSISGVYETSASKTETLNATAATVNGTKFKAVATLKNNYGWRVYNPGTANTLTISSKDGTTIKKIELTSTWGKSRTNNMLSVTAGTLSFDGSNPSKTVTINDVNSTSVTISGSGTLAGTTWCISSAKIYYEATVETAVEISDTENANVKTFTMPSSNVTISAAFELPALTLDETTDNSTALSTANGKVCDVTLSRTLQTGSYNTFAVPFSMTIPSGWTVKELSSASFNEGVLTLNFDNASSIEAGKPYLVKVNAITDLSAAAYTNVTVSKDAVPFISTDVDFIPTLGATTLVGDVKSILFLGAENKLINPSAENSSMKGFRAYFQLKGDAATARAFNINFEDGETTGIESLTPDFCPKREESIYTLDGRRVVCQPTMRSAEGRLYPQGLKKGIYVVSGKKVIIK